MIALKTTGISSFEKWIWLRGRIILTVSVVAIFVIARLSSRLTQNVWWDYRYIDTIFENMYSLRYAMYISHGSYDYSARKIHPTLSQNYYLLLKMQRVEI